MSGYLVVNRGVGYRGLDRSPWAVIEDLFYSDASRPWKGWYEREILNSFSIDFGVPLVSRSIIHRVVEVLTKQEGVNDFDVIFVSSLSEGNTPEDPSGYMGMDLYFSGYGSPILEGIIKRPELFPDCKVTLNENGLLERQEDIHFYMSYYNRIACDGTIEDFMSGSPAGLCASVWAVDLSVAGERATHLFSRQD